MKLFRWIYYTSMALFLIAGMYSGLKVYYVVFFTQLLIFLSVLGISLWTVYTFRFKQELSVKSCVKGEEVHLHLEIVNEKPIPLSLIEVKVCVVSCREDVSFIFSLAPYSGKTFDIPVATPYRGRYSVGMAKLKITDIFGLLSLPFDMRSQTYFRIHYRMRELIILPIARIPGTVVAHIDDTKSFGDPYLKQAQQGDSVSGARAYQDGDTLKRVHWKKSSQQGELFVKQYDYPERENVMILVDTSTHGLAGEDALVYADTVCECAASIALHSLMQNRIVYMVNSSDHGKPVECADISSFENARRHLAMLPFDNKGDLWGSLEKAKTTRNQAYALFVITRGADNASLRTARQLLASFKSATMVTVGGQKPGGHIHTLYVEEGANAAESLGSLFQ